MRSEGTSRPAPTVRGPAAGGSGTLTLPGLAIALSCLATGVAACVEPLPEPVETAPVESLDTASTPTGGRAYRRGFVFFSGDSVVVSWVADARSQPGGVVRRYRGWLHRGGTWDAFADAGWQSPPAREPWRMVPHGPVRLIVSEGGGLDRLVFQEPPRRLELRPGQTETEWAGPQGQVIRLGQARVSLSDRELRGTLADLSRSWSLDEEQPGDWMFLVSGDTLQAVMEQRVVGAPYHVWIQGARAEVEWPTVDVAWADTAAFEPARREVPARWLISTSDGDLTGELEVVSSDLEPGVGSGPVLPVDGLFMVRGTLTWGDRRPVEVYGVIRHQQS